MIDNIKSAGTGPVYPAAPTSRSSAAVAPAETPADTSIPDTPPAEVLHALDQAQQVMADLKSRQLALRFDVSDGHVRAQMVDSDGNVVREIPARHGLDMLAGENAVNHLA
jgi:hypothetical protein